MHRLLFLGFLLLTIISCNNDNKKTATETPGPSRHSAEFNRSIESLMDSYYQLSEAFVNWDSINAATLSRRVKERLDSLPIEELKKDSSSETTIGILDGAKNDLNAINAATGITSKRHAFNALSDKLFLLLNTVRYDRQKLYLQECPMAFNDEDPGHWLSPVDSIRNPYLGLHHPRYKGGMVECGETKEIINFTGSK
jgi:hypothetical protein